MRVKIGDKWFNSTTEPICIQISEGEQKQISEMDRSISTKGKYAVIPDTSEMSEDDIREWMQG